MVYKERFINPDQINDAIRIVQEMSAEQGLSMALIGGIALQVYGSPRLTKDIDFVSDILPSDPKGFRRIRPIGFGGFVYQAPLGGKVDIIVRNDGYASLYNDALQSSSMTPEGVPIASLEHLAAMKLAAFRDQDLLDLKWIFRQSSFDIKKAAAIIFRFLGQFGQERFFGVMDQLAADEARAKREGEELD